MITLYTYDELSEEAQEHVIAELEKAVVRDKIKHLDWLLERDLIAPDKYAACFGSTNDDFAAGKILAKAAAYYGTNKESVDSEVRNMLDQFCYSAEGDIYHLTQRL